MTGADVHQNNFNLIRLVAAVQVMLVHAFNHIGFEGPLVTALKVMPGVPTFFFISGLMIAASYERTSARGLQAFYTNRVLRIYPALWASVIVATLAVLATGYLDTQAYSGLNFLAWLVGQLSFLQFYNPEFMRGFGTGVLNGALWTITVELQFYVLTPLLYFMMVHRRAWFLLLIALSLALNLYFRFYLDWSRIEMKLAYVSFGPWIYMFLLGFLVHRYRERVARVLAKAPLALFAGAYVASMVLVGSYERNASNSINPLSYLLLAGLLLKAGTVPLPLPAAVATFVRRNDFSYGLYLYHMPVINLLLFTGVLSAHLSVLAVALTSATLAVLSWYLVERPFLRRKV